MLFSVSLSLIVMQNVIMFNHPVLASVYRADLSFASGHWPLHLVYRLRGIFYNSIFRVHLQFGLSYFSQFRFVLLLCV